MFHPKRQAQAFTLVELLVVIGIIALLISVLLPALNKARQAGNLVDCEARLHQMGEALQIYTVTNRGLLPWADFDRTATPDNNATTWWWYFTISDVLNKNILNQNGTIYRLSPIFRDTDTITGSNEGNYICHYTANPRILYEPQDYDYYPATYGGGLPIAPADRLQRKIANVKPSNVFVIWDAPQCMSFTPTSDVDQAYSAYGIAIEMDGNQMTFGHCFCLTDSAVNYSRPATPGDQQSSNAATCKSLQIKFNRDQQQAFNAPDGWDSQMRFRHLNNTTLAALCIDGHVETRRAGDMLLNDICTNVPN